MSDQPSDAQRDQHQADQSGIEGPEGVPARDGAYAEAGAQASPEEPVARRSPRIARPSEALDRLDRQWEDRRPLRQQVPELSGLVMTVAEDPAGFDFLGAMGLSTYEIADAWLGWLDAQLAADALELGRALRPRVALVPAGRLWYVIRTVGDVLIVIDGPGFLTPGAAVVAARRRYRALLFDEATRVPEAGPSANDDGDERRSGETAPAAKEPGPQ